MARFKNGLFGGFYGAVGEVVAYQLNGQLIIRSLPAKPSKPPTEKQLACRAKMKLINEVLAAMTPFLKIGFSGSRQKRQINPFNAAVSANLGNAIEGNYPDYFVNYAKLQVSAGPNVLQDLQPRISVEGNTLHYHWKNASSYTSTHIERAMLLAYEPNLKQAVYNLSGILRRSQTDFLRIPNDWQAQDIYAYLSFRNDAGTPCNNSIYLHL